MYNPEFISLEFAEKLASRERHIVFFLGAGTSCAAGLPDIAGLKTAAQDLLIGEDKDAYKVLGESRNIEEILSKLRLIAEVLQGETDKVSGFTQESALGLDKRICTAIAEVIRKTDIEIVHHERFATWLGLARYTKPIEIFTSNYDLLIERGLELTAVPYFDGFVGTYEGNFRADLVDSTEIEDGITPPSQWIRVWKLHGSITWTQVQKEGQTFILRVSSIEHVDPQNTLAIYPSSQKYQESRRIPFVVLGDRFRRSLSIPETLCIVSGYSFGDEHINEHLFDAARHHPSSEIIVLCFSVIPPNLAERAKSIPNLTILGPSSAVIGTIEGKWEEIPEETPFWKKGKFILGDFRALSKFLLMNSTIPEPKETREAKIT